MVALVLEASDELENGSSVVNFAFFIFHACVAVAAAAAARYSLAVVVVLLLGAAHACAYCHHLLSTYTSIRVDE